MYQWKKSVVAELFEEEFIVANLDNGLYYSIQGPIINILNQLPFASPEERILALKSEDPGLNTDSCNQVWQQLMDEELLSDQFLNSHSQQETAECIHTKAPNKLSKYADMQDLLALDPIHDVDEEGWPELQTAEKGE